MNRLMVFFTFFLLCELSVAQSDCDSDEYDKTIFLYEIKHIDTLLLVKNDSASVSICCEKKHLSEFEDRVPAFYSYWEVLPHAYDIVMPDDAFDFIFRYVLPSIPDSNIVSILKNEYFENGLPKSGFEDLWGSHMGMNPIRHHNLKYYYLKHSCYVVLIMPYKFYRKHIGEGVEYNYATPFGQKPLPPPLLRTPFADGLFIKLLFPLSYYQDSYIKSVSE